MPQVITPALLGSISNGLNTAFNARFQSPDSTHREFCFMANSTGAAEVYPRLDDLPGVREWIGDRLHYSLGSATFTITNRRFEETITIPRTAIEDDNYGMYSTLAAQFGEDAATYPGKLAADLMKVAFSTVGPDGQYFADTDHPSFTSAGAATTASNYSAGSSTHWWLCDLSKVLKPFILQTRIPFDLQSRFRLDDPNVFDNDEFVWGTRGRMAAGYGMWQLAYLGRNTFSWANVDAAYQAMTSLYGRGGKPLGIMPNALIVPPSLYPAAKELYESPTVANDPGTPTVTIPNKFRGMFRPISFAWLA